MLDARIATRRFRDVEMVPLENVLQTCMFCSSSCNMLQFTFFSNRFPDLFEAEANPTSTFRMAIARSVESSMLGLMGTRTFVMCYHAGRRNLSYS